MADDFCKEFAKVQEKYMVEMGNHKHWNKPNWMNDAEIMVILILLRKRALIETANDELKDIAQIERSRHRSFKTSLSIRSLPLL